MAEISDYIVVGSGFGGSVSTMRLAEKGYSVLCIEQGKRFSSSDFAKTNWNLKKYLWWPALGMYGIQKLSFYRQASILTGTGVGGGSLVYANTLFYPGKAFFNKGPWAGMKDWETELKPFYNEAGFMMGRTRLDRFSYEDRALKNVAERMGCGDSFENVFVAVNLNRDMDGKDPYYNGLGPGRNGCTDCAGCMVGCRENAKNTLDKNYLYFAEQFGASILPETIVEKVSFDGEIYEIKTVNLHKKRIKNTFYSRNIIISAGTMGTLKLLFKQKYQYQTLAAISDKLGENLLTNSETLCAVSSADQKLNNGVAISSVFHPDENTHVEIVKYPDKSNALKWFFSLAADGARNSFFRTMKLLWTSLTHPLAFLKTVFNMNWSSRLVIFLVMQDLENSMRMRWKNTIRGGKMFIENKGNRKVPAYIDIGQKVMREYAREVNGIPQNIILEVVMNRSTTAHILGGCLMGESIKTSVVNQNLEVHGYPGMYIIDGSVIQANPGVNPSYSILAMAEYAMSKIPSKNQNQPTLKDKINERTKM